MLSDNLPKDLVEEILVRLPVKCLVQFKCVAKSWYALITDFYFITKHLEWSSSISKNRRLKLMFQSAMLPPAISLISNREQPFEIQNIELPFPKNDLKWILAYSQCNGIFFLSGDYEGDVRRLILWNPATKEVKPIPDSQWQPKGIYYARYGFGFDPITKDYKLVRFPIRTLERKVQPLVEVYNLSTNSWRKIDVDDVSILEFCHSARGPYLNGAYHWLTCDPHDKINKFIMSFDFSKEAFGIIQSPPGITSSRIEDNLLSLVDQNLVWVVTHVSNEIHVEIWMMNEYGVSNSWIKKFDIRPFPYCWDVIEFWGDNEVFVYDNIGRQLISYNLRNHHRKRLQNHFRSMPIMDYVESLFPLGGHKKL